MLYIVTPLLEMIDTSVIAFVLEGSTRVAAAAAGPFKIGVTLYITFWGLALWRGLIQEPMSDGVLRCVKIVVIGALALNVAHYNEKIAKAVYNTSGELAAVLTGTNEAPATVIDVALEKANKIALEFVKTASIFSSGVGGAFALVLAAAAVWALAIFLVVIATALIIISKVGLALMLALGPVFIGLLIFEATKKFFESWLAQLLNLMMIFPLVTTTLALLFKLWSPAVDYARDNVGPGGFSAALPMFITGIGILVTLKQIPAIAGAIMGGAQVGEMGGVGWGGGLAGRAMQAIRPSSMRSASRSVQRDVAAVTAVGRWASSRRGNSIRR